MQVPREGLEQKLQRLSASQQSIESVSSFCIFYHKDARGVVAIWDAEFYKAPAERKLALLYLANHVLQEGRKKNMAFQEEFLKVLPKAVGHMAKAGDDKAKRAVNRLVAVWEERRVFGSRHIKSFRDVIGLPADAKPSPAKPAPSSGGGGSSSSGSIAKLGPASAKAQEFRSSWAQGVLATGSLSDVTAAHSKVTAYTAALRSEAGARKTALKALAAEVERQTAALTQAEGQLATTANQQQQLEQRLALLTSQMASAVASLGQLQQQNGGAAAGAPEPPGSPQAPELELDDDDDDDEDGGLEQASSGFADEADDPYDPEHPD